MLKSTGGGGILQARGSRKLFSYIQPRPTAQRCNHSFIHTRAAPWNRFIARTSWPRTLNLFEDFVASSPGPALRFCPERWSLSILPLIVASSCAVSISFRSQAKGVKGRGGGDVSGDCLAMLDRT